MFYKHWPIDIEYRFLELGNRIPTFEVLMPVSPNPKMAREREHAGRPTQVAEIWLFK
jgi:hypothetical protein